MDQPLDRINDQRLMIFFLHIKIFNFSKHQQCNFAKVTILENWRQDHSQAFCQVYLGLYHLRAVCISPRTWGGVKVGREDFLKVSWSIEPRRVLGEALGSLNAVYSSLSLPLSPKLSFAFLRFDIWEV